MKLYTGKVIQTNNPEMLVIVGGLCFNFLIAPLIHNLPDINLVPNKLVITVHTYGFSVWWAYAQKGMEFIGLGWDKLITGGFVIVVFAALALVLMYALPSERKVIHAASTNDFLTGLLTWVAIVSFTLILWTVANRYGLFYACCSIEAYTYQNRLFVIFPVFMLSVAWLIVIHFQEKRSAHNAASKDNVDGIEMGGVGTASQCSTTSNNPIASSSAADNEHHDEIFSNHPAACCHGRNPSCCAWTIIWGLVSLIAYTSYVINLSQGTFTYRMQRDDLDMRWDPKNAEVPLWLGEFGASGNDLWWNNIIKFLAETDVSFAYWALDGGRWEKRGEHNFTYVSEGFGLLNEEFTKVAKPRLIADMSSISDFIYPSESETPYYQGKDNLDNVGPEDIAKYSPYKKRREL